MVYGQFVQRHKNTKKPPNLRPEEWQSMGAKEREKAVKDWDEKCRFNGRSYNPLGLLLKSCTEVHPPRRPKVRLLLS